jgi:hypothetical protein
VERLRAAIDELAQAEITGVAGDPNGEVTFVDPDGNHCGTTRPRNLPPPIPTRTGTQITRAHQRAHALQPMRFDIPDVGTSARQVTV